jgi:hypothetical protein
MSNPTHFKLIQSMKMNPADVTKLMSELKINIRPRHRNLKNPDGKKVIILFNNNLVIFIC